MSNVFKSLWMSWKSLMILPNHFGFSQVTWDFFKSLGISSKSLVSFQITLKIAFKGAFNPLVTVKYLWITWIVFENHLWFFQNHLEFFFKSLEISLKSPKFLQNHFQITLKMNFRGLWIPLSYRYELRKVPSTQ